MDHPAITRTHRTGYPIPVRNPRIRLSDDVFCDVCDKSYPVVQLNHTRLCGSCASEEGIVVL